MTFAAVSIVALAVLVVCAMSYATTRRIEVARYEVEMREELRRVASRLVYELRTAETDLQILVRSPAVQALVRRGALPVETFEDVERMRLRARAEDEFAAFHARRLHYRQIRLIAADAEGHEIVRVDKRGGDVVTVARDQLQAKGGEPYVAAGRLLKPGNIHVSPLTWNRENGQISRPRTAMLRFVMPVPSSASRQPGMIVINVPAETMLAAAFRAATPRHGVMLLDETGGSYLFDPETGMGRLRLDEPPPVPPEVLELVRSGAPAADVRSVGSFAVAAMSAPRSAIGTGRMQVALLAERSALLQAARLGSRGVALTGLVVTLAAVVAARLATIVHLRPLLRMNAEIRRARATKARPDLPITRRDEIGEVARSFAELMANSDALERRARTILHGVHDGIMIVDDAGRIDDLNDALCEILDRPRVELLGSAVARILPEGEATLAQLQGGPDEGGLIATEARRADGSRVPLEVSASRLGEGEGRIWACILRDVSERSAQEAERDCLIAALEQSNAELDAFANVASHDLKAPLRVIRNAATWIEEDLEGSLDEETRETLALMRSRADRMQALLDDLLEHAQIGRKTGESGTRFVSGAEMRAGLLALLDPPDAFEVRFCEGFDDLNLPEMPLKIVLLNFVSNAIKHHDRADGCVRIGIRDEGAVLRVDVRDDGPGIAPQYHERIFGLFQTLRARDAVEGSGMGLAIARKHIVKAGGRVTIESDGQGNGTLFSFTWPLRGARGDYLAA
ncbi:sensor histidine kinase [Salipiger mucosus]|nr:ATP-binding protein [Salipiger mucosus]